MPRAVRGSTVRGRSGRARHRKPVRLATKPWGRSCNAPKLALFGAKRRVRRDLHGLVAGPLGQEVGREQRLCTRDAVALDPARRLEPQATAERQLLEQVGRLDRVSVGRSRPPSAPEMRSLRPLRLEPELAAQWCQRRSRPAFGPSSIRPSAARVLEDRRNLLDTARCGSRTRCAGSSSRPPRTGSRDRPVPAAESPPGLHLVLSRVEARALRGGSDCRGCRRTESKC